MSELREKIAGIISRWVHEDKWLIKPPLSPLPGEHTKPPCMTCQVMVEEILALLPEEREPVESIYATLNGILAHIVGKPREMWDVPGIEGDIAAVLNRLTVPGDFDIGMRFKESPLPCWAPMDCDCPVCSPPVAREEE